jgi:hypothetical protein
VVDNKVLNIEKLEYKINNVDTTKVRHNYLELLYNAIFCLVVYNGVQNCPLATDTFMSSRGMNEGLHKYFVQAVYSIISVKTFKLSCSKLNIKGSS